MTSCIICEQPLEEGIKDDIPCCEKCLRLIEEDQNWDLSEDYALGETL